MHQQGHQEGEGLENTSDTEQTLLGTRFEAPHPHGWSDQVPQKEDIKQDGICYTALYM